MYRSKPLFLMLTTGATALAALAIHWLNRPDPALLDQASSIEEALNRKVSPQQAAMEALQGQPLLDAEYTDAMLQRREALRTARARPAQIPPGARETLAEMAARRLQARSREAAEAANAKATNEIDYSGIRFAKAARPALASESGSSDSAEGRGGLDAVAGDGQDTESIEIAISETAEFVAKGGAGVAAGALEEAIDFSRASSAFSKAYETLGLLRLGSAAVGGLGAMSFLANTYLPQGFQTVEIDPKAIKAGSLDSRAGLSVGTALPFMSGTYGGQSGEEGKSMFPDSAMDLANLALTGSLPEALLFDSAGRVPMNPPLVVDPSAVPGLVNSLVSRFASVDPLGAPGGGLAGKDAADIDSKGVVTPVPEPSTLALVLTGLALFVFGCWRRRSGANQ